MDEHDLESICPKLRNFVQEVANFRPGVSLEPVKVRNLQSGRNSATMSIKPCKNDRFSIVIPYCNKHLVWDVIFLCDRPELPPDFYFKDGNFLDNADCDLIEKKFPSLAQWDHTDPKALSNVIKEFLCHFKFCQFHSIPENHRASSELEMLLSNVDDLEDVEILNEVDSIKALVGFKYNGGLQADCKLVWALSFDGRSDRVRSSLKAYGRSKLWDASDNFEGTFYNNKTLVFDIFLEVKNKINQIFETKLRLIARRKQIVLQYFVTFKSSIVEFDSIEYTFVVLHLSRDNFSFFLKIDLKNLPERDPQYRLISHYCFKDMNSLDCVEYSITNVKYHHQMPPHMVVEAFYTRFFEVFHNFRRSSLHLLEKNLDSLRA
nr:PREDICTED: BRCA1-A complex subunit BRE-like [Bemisia tabaci]